MLSALSNVKGLHFITSDMRDTVIEEKIQSIAKTYVLKGLSPIAAAIHQYRTSSDKYLLGLFSVGEVDQEEQWICVYVIKKEDGHHQSTLSFEDAAKQGSASIYEEIVKTLTLIFNEKSYKFTAKQLSGDLSNAWKEALEGTCTLSESFDQMVVKYGLSKVRIKPHLKRFLPSLESVLTTTPKFILDEERFKLLCEKLNSKNFVPYKGDATDLRVKILKFIVQLKNNGNVIDSNIIKDVFESKDGFLVKQKSIFLKEIVKYDQKLLVDPRIGKTKAFLQFAINDRIEYLCNKHELVPVTAHEVIEMFDYFVMKKEIVDLKNKKDLLEEDCVKKFKKIQTSNIEDDAKLQASIDKNMELQKLHHELEYLRIKFSIRDDCNFKNLIPVIASKALDKNKVPANFLNKVFELGIPDTLMKRIIDIIFKLPKIDEIYIPDEIYKHFTAEQLIELTKHLSAYSDTLIDHLITIIIKNDKEVVRKQALDALKHLTQELSDETKAIIDLETKIQSNTDTATDMLNHVNKNYRLTWNCFQKLNHSGNEELTIIKIIINNDLQRLPKFLIKWIKKEIKSKLVPSKPGLIQTLINQFSSNDITNLMLNFYDSMIIGNYMKFAEVDCLVDYLKEKKYQEVVLNIILTATQKGEIISDAINKELQMIQPKTDLVYNCIRAVTKKQTPFDILKNSRKSIEDRKSALNLVINDQTYHIDYLVHILVDLVIFEPKLREDAFEAFLIVINPDTWKNFCDRFAEMVDAIKGSDSRVSIKAINDASKKELFRHNDCLIEYLLYQITGEASDDKTQYILILQDMLTQNTNEAWIETLLNVVCSEQDAELKVSVLRLITEGFNLESVNPVIEQIIGLLKTLMTDKISDTDLLSLIDNIKDGLIMLEPIAEQDVTYVPKYTSRTTLSLLVVHVEQSLPSLLRILEKIEENPTILDNVHLLMIFYRAMKFNQKLSIKVIQRLLELLTADDRSVSLLAQSILGDYLKRWKDDDKLTSLKLQFIEELKKHCLAITDVETAKEALKSLILVDDTISMNDQFIHDYYEVLRPSLKFSNDASQENLTTFISTTTNKNRIQLLHALTVTILNDSQLNPEMFVQKSESPLKDLLVDILVQSIIVQTGEMDEIALFDFFTEMKDLELILTQHNQQIEPILEYLIDLNPDSFETISDVLFHIKDKDALQIFLSNAEDIDKIMYEMKEIILKKRLPLCSSQQLKWLLKELAYHSMRTIEKLVDIEYESPEDLITFVKRFQSNLDFEQQESFLNEIGSIRTLQVRDAALSSEIIENLVKESEIPLFDEMDVFKQKLLRVLDSGWAIRSIKMILDSCKKNTKDVKSILPALDILSEYNLKEYDADVTGKSLIEIVYSTPVINWKESFHKVAVFQTFPGTYHKPIQQLFEEIFKLNSGHDIGYLKDRQRIQQDYKAVNKAFHSKSLILSETSSTISNYDKNLIKKWAQRYKDHQHSLYESIAVAMRAVMILKNFSPRDIQILSLLCLLNPETNKGRLAQINTGEGKTTIVAMLAVIKALHGHTIDIITSSGELARPQSLEMEPFYSMFDLTVAHNGEDPKNIKERYKANILYGAADAFQGDILRDEYSKLGTRNGRNCDLAIVDEVDSMLIDGKNHIVMLSSFMPAMNYLETILAAIYIQIGTVANLIVEKNGKAYLVERKNRINDDGSPMKDVEDELVELTGTKRSFIKRTTELHIRKVLRDIEGLKAFSEDEQKFPSDYTKLSIPKHLYELVTGTQLKKWIDSAIHAMFKCELNKHYVLTEDGKVAPVDATNTGVIQQNMHWNNGLHQFLQIKHGAKITPENLTTNFISNVSFFKRYGANLFGLTGTLGSDDSINLLNNTYSVDSLIIPPFKQKQHHELTPIIVTNEKDWYDNIIESTLQKLHQGQGVLIIARYINQVNIIHDRLKSKYDPQKIKVYKTQRESDSVHAELKVGEVIIATNIAGRGTDIKPSPKIDENGGLHVCLTFLPENARVEAQNVGRTSRTGNKGTSQFILLEKSNQSLNHLRRIRNENETDSLKKAETEMARVCTKDAVFHQFCNFLNNFEKDEIRPVEERFGIWLQMNAEKFETESENTLLTLFNKTFEKPVLKDLYVDHLVQNNCFFILKAYAYINSENYDDAIVECDKAIKTDPDYADVAYYYRGYCRIKQYGGDSVSKSLDKDMVELARDDFKKTREIINKRLLELNIIQKASDGPNLSEQVKHKIIIYQQQLGTIEKAIGIDKNESNEELSNLKKYEKKFKENLRTLNAQLKISENEELRKQIEDFNKQIKDIQNRMDKINKDLDDDTGGVIGKALDDKCDIRIEMMELQEALPPDQDSQYCEEEIDEFKSNGMVGHFNISELKPIPWIEVIAMALIGLVQVVAGSLITVFSLGGGSSIGMGLIMEGVSDLITAVKDGIYNRNIDWKTWGIMKGVSLVVSLCTCGMGAIKDAVKTVAAVGQGIKSLAQQVTKEGLKIAVKNAGLQLAKGVVKEAVIALVEYGLEHTLLNAIEKGLIDTLQPKIQDAIEKIKKVQELLEIDQANRNGYFQSLIRQAARNILSPQNHERFKSIGDVAKEIGTGIARKKLRGFATLEKVYEILKESGKLILLEEEFHAELNKSVDKIWEEKNKSKTQSKKTSKKSENKQQEIIGTNLESPKMYDSDINLNKVNEEQEHAAVQQGYVNYQQVYKSISEEVANKMTYIIRSGIVMPVVHVAADFTIDKLTSGIEKNLNQELETYKSNRTIHANENRLPDKIKARYDDADFMKGAKEKAEGLIETIKEGGEAGLIEARYLSEEIGHKIKIYDENGKLYKVINDHLPGKALKLEHHPGKDGKPGHWTLPGGVEPTVSTGSKNCLFDVIAHQLSDTESNKLRELTVKQLTQNVDRLAIVAPEIEKVKMFGEHYLKYGGDAIIFKRTIVEIANSKKKKKRNKANLELEEFASIKSEQTFRNSAGLIIAQVVRAVFGPYSIKTVGNLSKSEESQQNLLDKGFEKGDHMGHIVARSFGGSGAYSNLAPMSREFNGIGGAYYLMESDIRRHIKQDKVWYDAEYILSYNPGYGLISVEISCDISKEKGGKTIMKKVYRLNALANEGYVTSWSPDNNGVFNPETMKKKPLHKEEKTEIDYLWDM